jgi:hypothetical protein
MKAPKTFRILWLNLLLMIRGKFIKLSFRCAYHASHWKCKVSMPGFDASSYYMNKTFVHSKNEK